MAKRLGVLSLLMLALTVAFGTGTANADFKICSGSGKLTAVNGTPHASWQISGQGDCFGPHQPRALSFVGKGYSNGLGLCTPGHLLVKNLHLSVLVTQQQVVSGAITKHYEIWSAPITTFPLATPFLVSSGGLAGAGVAIHHIHLNCGDDGLKPSAVFEWATLR